MTRLFDLVYKRVDRDLDGLGGSVKDNKPESVAGFAEEFVKKVPEREFSPAEVISHLLAKKHSPRQAIDNVEKWVERTRDEKRKVKRVDSWALGE
ncbi:hypothetical protein CLCR_01008 [Cladophialophora carrionii]|uniref:Mitochondrial chaperone BCS1-like ATPase lid domain-containing protein n=1 Tax=Cladophialophora carrionii TaxID=86049 RepID=A0A1C1D0P8_9EURO|nr:hypothetical protein CLCR_01008 [Cladophialophora carrionii]